MADTIYSDLKQLIYPTLDFGSTTEPILDYSQMDYILMKAVYDGDPSVGFQMGQAFARPIVTIVSGLEMGKPPTCIIRARKDKKEEEDLTSFANDWLRGQHSTLVDAVITKNRLGDCYVAFNLDRNLEAISPIECDPGFNLFDNNLLVLKRVIKKTVMDPKTLKKGEVTTKTLYTNEKITSLATAEKGSGVSLNNFGKPKIEYPHTIGECPVVHIANNPRTDSVFGTAEFAPCIPYMNFWHKVLVKGFQAQQYHGSPTMWINGINSGVDAWVNKTFNISPGENSDTVRDKMHEFFSKFKIFPLGEGQEIGFVESKNPLGSTEVLLRVAFQGIVNLCMIPEFLFGSAIESANASVREQFMALKLYIQLKRAVLVPHLIRLITWAVQYQSIITQNLATDLPLGKPVIKSYSPEQLEDFEIIINWPPILNSDEELRVEILQMLSQSGAVSFATLWDNFAEYIPDGQKELKRLVEQRQNKDLQPINNGPTGAPGTNSPQAATKRAGDRKTKDQGNSGNNPSRGTK